MAKEAGRTSSKSAKTTTKTKSKSPASAARPAAGAKTSKRAAEPAATKRSGPVTEPMTKSQMHAAIAESVGLTKSQVDAVLGELTNLIGRHLSSKGAGVFTLSGLLKITRAKKPATKARVGRNPRTGETIEIAARPARTVVRLRALKGLKEMI
jgi:nucleoid DNA-binding protein